RTIWEWPDSSSAIYRTQKCSESFNDPPFDDAWREALGIARQVIGEGFHDMLKSGRLHFPDSSKLISNAADLTWTEPNLYGLLFHHLGNADSDFAKRFGESYSGLRKETIWHGAPSRYVPPGELVGDRRTQQELFVRIAGPYMGTDHRRGHTYTWLPNHLMD